MRTDSIVAGLRAAIVAGRLKPGTRLRQEAIAREYGVSRIPVREALRRLEAEGLTTILPNRGARVAKLDVDEYSEIYKIREPLEILAITESAPLLTDEHCAQLRITLEKMEAETDPGEWVDRDRSFHFQSYQAAPMPRLLRLVEDLWNATQQYRRAFMNISMSDPREMALLRAEHRLILDALERRDGADGGHLIASHFRRTRRRLAKHGPQFDSLLFDNKIRGSASQGE